MNTCPNGTIEPYLKLNNSSSYLFFSSYEHQPAVLPGHTPVGVGLGYSTIAWIPEAQGSWALPLRHERISSWDTPIAKAASQLKQVLEHLPHRPLVLFEREYGCAPLVLETAGLRADKLMRLRSNRCLYGCSTDLFRSRTAASARGEIQT